MYCLVGGSKAYSFRNQFSFPLIILSKPLSFLLILLISIRLIPILQFRIPFFTLLLMGFQLFLTLKSFGFEFSFFSYFLYSLNGLCFGFCKFTKLCFDVSHLWTLKILRGQKIITNMDGSRACQTGRFICINSDTQECYDCFLFMYNVKYVLFLQYVTNVLTGIVSYLPGLKLNKKGLSVLTCSMVLCQRL